MVDQADQGAKGGSGSSGRHGGAGNSGGHGGAGSSGSHGGQPPWPWPHPSARPLRPELYNKNNSHATPQRGDLCRLGCRSERRLPCHGDKKTVKQKTFKNGKTKRGAEAPLTV